MPAGLLPSPKYGKLACLSSITIMDENDLGGLVERRQAGLTPLLVPTIAQPRQINTLHFGRFELAQEPAATP